LIRRPLSNTGDEVAHNREIDDQDDDLHAGDAVRELVDLQRQEGGGDDDGEVFRPPLAESETGAFGNDDGGVEEAADAQRLELFRIQ